MAMLCSIPLLPLGVNAPYPDQSAVRPNSPGVDVLYRKGHAVAMRIRQLEAEFWVNPWTLTCLAYQALAVSPAPPFVGRSLVPLMLAELLRAKLLAVRPLPYSTAHSEVNVQFRISWVESNPPEAPVKPT